MAALIELKQEAAILARAALRDRQVPVFRALFDDRVRMEAAAARSALRRGDIAAFDRWIDSFYPGWQRDMALAMLGSVDPFGAGVAELALEEVGSTVTFNSSLLAAQYSQHMAARWTNDSVAQLRQIMRDVKEEVVEDALIERIDEWGTIRAAESAEREATQAGGAFAKFAFLAADVNELTWRAVGESCPLCQSMHGRSVEITRPFLDVGAELVAERDGETTRMVTKQLIGHPPLHGMGGRGGVCDCLVAAA